MKNLYTPAIAVMMAGLVSLTGCSNDNRQSTQAKSVETTKTNLPIYKVGMDIQYPPYEFIGENGEAVGFEVELLQAVAKDQGFELSIEPTHWELLLKGVSETNYDIAIGGFAKSDVESDGKYLFSTPHVYGEEAIAVLSSSDAEVPKSFNQLKDYKVSTLAKSSWTDDLSKIMPKDDVLAEKTSFLAFQQLINGNADAMLNDKGVLTYYQQTIPEYPVTFHSEGDYFEAYPMVFLISNNNSELQSKINQGIVDIVKNGKYTQIYSKWFESKPIKLPTLEKVSTESEAVLVS